MEKVLIQEILKKDSTTFAWGERQRIFCPYLAMNGFWFFDLHSVTPTLHFKLFSPNLLTDFVVNTGELVK